jgi:DNA-binding CsgD family transcriptional regulator
VPAISAERVRSDVVRLAHRGLDVNDYALAVVRRLRTVVPFDGLCMITLDPATMLPTGHVIENGLPEGAPTRRLLEIEVAEPDVNKFTELARRQPSVAILSESTEGALDRSRRHRELRRPHGLGDELRAALSGSAGTWGGLVFMREASSARFTSADAKLVAAICRELAEGLRRAILLTAARDDQDAGLGMVLLAADGSIESVNRAAGAWIDELDVGGRAVRRLPPVVEAVAARARLVASGATPAQPAAARVRTRSGRWLLIRGSTLSEGPDARVVVVIEAARSPELAPLIADAYGLTDRERTITRLVAQGLSTNEIGSRLHLSPYTVQDHLKAIFEKADVSTRGALVARVFFEHYAPRLTATGPFAAPDHAA